MTGCNKIAAVLLLENRIKEIMTAEEFLDFSDTEDWERAHSAAMNGQIFILEKIDGKYITRWPKGVK